MRSPSKAPVPDLVRALELIEAERLERTGVLDLGNLGLIELPDALFAQDRGWLWTTNPLQHLRVLNLGTRYPQPTADGGVRDSVGAEELTAWEDHGIDSESVVNYYPRGGPWAPFWAIHNKLDRADVARQS